MPAKIKVVRAFGGGDIATRPLLTSSDLHGTEASIAGDFGGGLAIELEDGRQVVLGDDHGDGSLQLWLENSAGEKIQGGPMSWSPQYEIDLG